eukprot:768446-Hanusia_phi.AAC.4
MEVKVVVGKIASKSKNFEVKRAVRIWTWRGQGKGRGGDKGGKGCRKMPREIDEEMLLSLTMSIRIREISLSSTNTSTTSISATLSNECPSNHFPPPPASHKLNLDTLALSRLRHDFYPDQDQDQSDTLTCHSDQTSRLLHPQEVGLLLASPLRSVTPVTIRHPLHKVSTNSSRKRLRRGSGMFLISASTCSILRSPSPSPSLLDASTNVRQQLTDRLEVVEHGVGAALSLLTSPQVGEYHSKAEQDEINCCKPDLCCSIPSAEEHKSDPAPLNAGCLLHHQKQPSCEDSKAADLKPNRLHHRLQRFPLSSPLEAQILQERNVVVTSVPMRDFEEEEQEEGAESEAGQGISLPARGDGLEDKHDVLPGVDPKVLLLRVPVVWIPPHAAVSLSSRLVAPATTALHVMQAAAGELREPWASFSPVRKDCSKLTRSHPRQLLLPRLGVNGRQEEEEEEEEEERNGSSGRHAGASRHHGGIPPTAISMTPVPARLGV